jgi:hypothetical protein
MSLAGTFMAHGRPSFVKARCVHETKQKYQALCAGWGQVGYFTQTREAAKILIYRGLVGFELQDKAAQRTRAHFFNPQHGLFKWACVRLREAKGPFIY